MRYFLTLAFLAMPLAARANGYDDVQASAQAGIYAAPQQALVPNYPAVQSQVIERQVTIPAQYEDVVEQRVVRQQVAPARTFIQRDVVQSYDTGCAASALSYAPLRSFSTGCGVQAQAFSNVGYGVQSFARAPLRQNVVVQRAPLLRAPRLFGLRGRSVVKSKAKTVVRN